MRNILGVYEWGGIAEYKTTICVTSCGSWLGGLEFPPRQKVRTRLRYKKEEVRWERENVK